MDAGLAIRRNTASVLQWLVLALVYFGAANASLGLAVPPGYATPVWPPAGIAVGALAMWGMRLWPGVWAGAALANFSVGQSAGLAAWIASGNTLEAVCAVLMARKFINSRIDFDRPEAVVLFGMVAAVAALVAATLALPGLVYFEAVQGGDLLTNAFTWWLGDTAGIMLLAPLLLAWAKPGVSLARRVSRNELAIFGVLLIALLGFVFSGDPGAIGRRPGAFMVLVSTIWAGCRFDERTITSVALMMVGIAVWATTQGVGPFALADVNLSLLYLQAFASVVALVGLALHALRRQRDDPALALARLREAQLAEAQRLARIGSWHWDIKSSEATWSDELYRIFGRSPAEFSPTYEGYLSIVEAQDRVRVESAIRESLRTREPFSHEYRARLPDGQIRHMHARGYAECDASGEAVAMHGTCQDITERKAAEEQARTNEDRFRMLVENAYDFAIFMLDADGRIASWNSGAERLNGYRADEVLGRHVSCLYPPQPAGGDADENLRIAATVTRFEAETWRVRKDGTHYWAHVIVTPVRDEDGNLLGYAKITHDISERKRAEEDLRSYAARLLATSRRLLQVQEAERRRLAGELHDRVGPNLTALGINLELLEGSLNAESATAASGVIEDSKVLLRETVATTRAVMGELRPQVLADYGLLAALRGMAAGFSGRTGIEVKVLGPDAATRLPRAVELALFRIAQEALNNVGKHSHARSVELRCAETGGLATLEIFDDGIGFDRERVEPSTDDSGWGLIIMRERAEAVGAHFVLEASPGRGVRLRVEYRT